MARPRLHSLDDVLDVAEKLVTADDPAGLTLRALATGAGASNGTIYHAFGSREELLARLWLRAASRLGAIMREAVQNSIDGERKGEGARQAVVAVALSPVVLARRHRETAQLFFAQRRDQLFSIALTPEIVDELGAIQERFTELLVSLARRVWGRADRTAVETIAACVVDVPGGLLRRPLLEGREIDRATEHRIEAAVRGILNVPLDAPQRRPTGAGS
jgi:AcrR family transcriptional regulator